MQKFSPPKLRKKTTIIIMLVDAQKFYWEMIFMAAKGALLKTAENNLNSLGNALSKKLGTTINSGREVDESKLTGS